MKTIVFIQNMDVNATKHEQSTTSKQSSQLKLLILRGSPGSGKTTFATKNNSFKTWKIVSADMFFTRPDGKYVFDRTKLQDAHNQCFTDAYNYLSQGFNVIVDNTNRLLSEFRRYFNLTDNKHLPKVEIRVYSMHFYYGSTKILPHHVIDRYFKEYEPLPGEKYVSLNLATGSVLFHQRTEKYLPIGAKCNPGESAKLKLIK